MQQDPIDYSRKWYVMTAVAMSIFLATIDGSIVNVALPTLVRELDTTFATVQWVVLSYLLTQATLLLSVGRLGDMVGKKTIYVSGFVVFTTGSVLCGLSPTIPWLVASRIVQAVGAAMMLALGTAIVTEAFPPSERGKALGIIGASVSVGVVLGPTIGGILIQALSWHWIFFVNLPIGILGTWMAWRFVPAFKPVGKQRFDYIGAITLFFSLLAFLLALTLGQPLGFTDGRILLLFVVWAVLLAAFIWIEWNSAQPMIDLRLFRNRLFSINLVTAFITFIAIAGVFILIPFYLENVLGYSTLQVGFMLAIVPIALGITAPISGSFSDRFGTRPITVVGLSILVVGYFGMSTLTAETSVAGYVIRLLPIGVGMGIFSSPNNSAVMGSAPRERLGIASSLLAVTRTLGQTTGVAVFGAIWAALVIANFGEVLPGGASTAPVDAQVAGLQGTYLISGDPGLLWAAAEHLGRHPGATHEDPGRGECGTGPRASAVTATVMYGSSLWDKKVRRCKHERNQSRDNTLHRHAAYRLQTVDGRRSSASRDAVHGHFIGDAED
ncbi:MAG: MFS transporter [Caldilineaceae bacterium]|nr:MFS transporter [Caldilineaceae bacterium]